MGSWGPNVSSCGQRRLTLIRLGGCPSWSESSLDAKVILLVLLWGGSYFHSPNACSVHFLSTRSASIRATSWENLFLSYAYNKRADQPAHPRSLISAFIVRWLDSIIPPVSISEIASIYIASAAAQASLSLPWSQTPKTGFLVTRPISKHEPSYYTQNQK